jgi:hypothetical protein
VIKDDGTVAGKPLLTLDQPVDGQPWSDPIHVAGRTVGGARVSIGGIQLTQSGDMRFEIDAPSHNVKRNGVLAVRVDYDKQVHYFMRRAGTGDHTVATKTFDFSGPKGWAAVNQTMTAARDKVDKCNAERPIAAKLTLQIKIAPNGEVTSVLDARHNPPAAQAELVKCVSRVVGELKFPPSPDGDAVNYSFAFAFAGAKTLPPCDANTLVERGTDGEAMGAHAAALVSFESAYQCKADLHTASLAFMAACNARNLAKARQWWTKLPEPQRDRLFQLCVRNGISRDALDH